MNCLDDFFRDSKVTERHDADVALLGIDHWPATDLMLVSKSIGSLARIVLVKHPQLIRSWPRDQPWSMRCRHHQGAELLWSSGIGRLNSPRLFLAGYAPCSAGQLPFLEWQFRPAQVSCCHHRERHLARPAPSPLPIVLERLHRDPDPVMPARCLHPCPRPA